MNKPSIPKGTRDFDSSTVKKRQHIASVITGIFEKYGFRPIETPSMENMDTLTGKYGDEGDQLLFKILDSGDYLKKAEGKPLQERDSRTLTNYIAGKGLRYDLTIPFARYVVMHRNEITFPFRRYQIQPVWRADRPQKGRYREFWQCDADVIGTDSLLCEAELASIYVETFQRLGIPAVIRINNRKILAGLAESFGISNKFVDFTIAIDKLEKIGMEGVRTELIDRNIDAETAGSIISFLQSKPDIDALKQKLRLSTIGSKGIEEVVQLYQFLPDEYHNYINLDITLARGLNYYTGIIFEAVTNAVQIGSIGGGGRYDDLTGLFGLPDISGVGISFGLDRIYDVMEELALFQDIGKINARALVVTFDNESFNYGINVIQSLRRAGISSEMYPEWAKMKKQMSYADSLGIPYVIIIGGNEMESGLLTLKDMQSGEQESKRIGDIIDILKTCTHE